MKAAFTLAMMIGLVVGTARAQTVPSGSYFCTTYQGTRLGTLELRGNSYRGILLEPTGPFHPVAYEQSGTMTFSAGLGVIEPVAAVYQGTQGSVGSRPWMRIDYKAPDGSVQSMSCEREGD